MNLNNGDVVCLTRCLEPYEKNDANGKKMWVIDEFSYTLNLKNKSKIKQTMFPVFGHTAGIFLEKVYVEIFDKRAKRGDGKLRKLMHCFYFGERVFIEPSYVAVIMTTADMV